MKNLVSMRELSRRAGVTLRAIQLAVKRGRIAPAKVEQHGKTTRVFFDPDQTVADFHNSRDESKKVMATRAEAGKGPQPDYKKPRNKKKGNQVQAPAKQDPKNLNLFSAGDAPTQGAQAIPAAGKPANLLSPAMSKLHDSRAQREKYNAKMAELKYNTETKTLVPAEPVKILVFDMGQKVQINMLSIPARVSAIIAAEKNEKKIYDLLTSEITQALESLSNAQLDEIFK